MDLQIISSTLVASVSFDKTLRLFNPHVTNGKAEVMGKHGDWIYKVSQFSPDILITVSRDKTAKLWSVDQRRCIKTLSLKDSGLALKVLLDGTVVTGGYD